MTLGAYIQVPFCQSKCTYCNFHTGAVAPDRYQPYAEAVCREIAESAPAGAPVVDTVYVGGGTPSLLDPSALEQILAALRAAYRLEAQEITLEADPETVTPAKAAAWRAAGFDRISLGAQSFHDAELRAAGRMHRREDIFAAVDMLRTAGFRNASLDLIAGLPHQTAKSWEESVSQLLRIYPEHVSIYLLEIDEGSRLGRESLDGGRRYSAGAITSDDAMADFYDSACRRLAEAGYEHYEISNWALPGRRSRHNLKYWRRDPYLGFGAGAHSFDGAVRWANVHDAARYVRLLEQGGSAREQFDPIHPFQALQEEFFLGLRQIEGIDLARIERQYAELGDRLAQLHERIARLRAQGLVETEGTLLRLAPDKLTVSNEALVELLG